MTRIIGIHVAAASSRRKRGSKMLPLLGRRRNGNRSNGDAPPERHILQTAPNARQRDRHQQDRERDYQYWDESAVHREIPLLTVEVEICPSPSGDKNGGRQGGDKLK